VPPRRALRVLSVIHYPFFGGPQNQALRLTGPLASRSVETVVILPSEPGNAAARLRSGGVRVIEIPLHRLRARPSLRIQAAAAIGFLPEVRALRRIIRRERIDVVQIGGLVNPHAAIAARLEHKPVVWQLLDTRPPMALRRILMPLVTRLADVIMTTGHQVAAVHPGAAGFGERVVEYYPPVDTALFTPDALHRASVRHEMNVPDDDVLIATVANLTPQKGLERFVRVANAVTARVPTARFGIFGAEMASQDEYATRIRDLVKRSPAGRAGRLDIRNPGIRVHEVLPAFDVFLLTSDPLSEGIPTTILEAMACGLPVVSTDVGAVSEVVSQETGVVVQSSDDEPIIAALLKLIGDHATRIAMSQRARDHATTRFDVETCADVHVAAYEAALAHHDRHGHGT
jgi:glycosyltransferase involved in cell wall biosynthesis